MTITYDKRTTTLVEHPGSSRSSSFVMPEAQVHWVNTQARMDSTTRSVTEVTNQEQDPNSYEFMRAGHVLAFWDAPEEDIYGFGDGEPL